MILNIALIAMAIGGQPQYSPFLDNVAEIAARRCTTEVAIDHFSINYGDMDDVYRIIGDHIPRYRVREFSCRVHDCSMDRHNVTCYFIH
jgi:hypothetical protein